MTPDAQTSAPIDGAFDLHATLSLLRHGRRDPSLRFVDAGCDWAIYTPEGPAALAIRHSATQLRAQAWGPGARCAMENVADLVGLSDDAAAFVTDVAPIKALMLGTPGVRMPRVLDVASLLTPIVLQQLVTGQEATAAYLRLVRQHGEAAPGPLGLGLLPTARRLADLPAADYQACGALGKQALAIKHLNFRARRMNEARDMSQSDAMARLTALPGLGPWTAGMAMVCGLAFADVVPTGDFHLANSACYVLEGRARGTDADLLRLLAPFAPHRGRVAILLHRAGVLAPRFGPGHRIRHRGR